MSRRLKTDEKQLITIHRRRLKKSKPSNLNLGIRLMKDFFMKIPMMTMMTQQRKMMPIKSTWQERAKSNMMTTKFLSMINQMNQMIYSGTILLNKSIFRPLMKKNFSSPYFQETFLKTNGMKFSLTFKPLSLHQHPENITEDSEH